MQIISIFLKNILLMVIDFLLCRCDIALNKENVERKDTPLLQGMPLLFRLTYPKANVFETGWQ